jgi:hypothetical protein
MCIIKSIFIIFCFVFLMNANNGKKYNYDSFAYFKLLKDYLMHILLIIDIIKSRNSNIDQNIDNKLAIKLLLSDSLISPSRYKLYLILETMISCSSLYTLTPRTSAYTKMYKLEYSYKYKKNVNSLAFCKRPTLGFWILFGISSSSTQQLQIIPPEQRSTGLPPPSTQLMLRPHSNFAPLYLQVCGITVINKVISY